MYQILERWFLLLEPLAESPFHSFLLGSVYPQAVNVLRFFGHGSAPLLVHVAGLYLKFVSVHGSMVTDV